MLNYLLNWYRDWRDRNRTFGAIRSPQWESVRGAWIKQHPKCAVCGTDKDIQIHHVIAFHTDQSKELDEKNLISLCEGSNKDCHRLFGHLGSFLSINENVRKDAEEWNKRILQRPKWNGKICKWEYDGILDPKRLKGDGLTADQENT